MRRSAKLLQSLAVFLAIVILAPAAIVATPSSAKSKLGPLARGRAARTSGSSQVIVRTTDATSVARVADAIERVGGKLGRTLPLLKAQVADVPNVALTALADTAEDLGDLAGSAALLL